MSDKKDGPGKGPERAPETGGAKRPFATIDLKATEVREAAKSADPKAAAANAAASAAASPQAPAAAKVAAASAAAAGSKPDDTKPAAGMSGPAAAASAAKPGPASATDAAKAQAPAASSPSKAATAALPRSGSGLGGFVSHAVAGVLGGVLALVGGQQLGDVLGMKPATPVIAPEVASRLAALEKSAKERPAIDEANVKARQTMEAGLKQIEGVTGQVTSLADAQKKLAADAAALKQAQEKLAGAGLPAERVQKLEDQLAAMRSAAEANPQAAGRLPQLAQLIGKVTDLEGQLATRLEALRKDLVQDLESRTGAAAEASEAAKAGTRRLDKEMAEARSETTRVGQRVDALRTSTDKLDGSIKLLEQSAGSFKAALDGFKAEVEAQMKAVARPADIARALTPLADKVAAMEGSMQGVVKADEDRRQNAERIVLSLELGNLKRAMERGSPYASELAEVKKISGGRLDLAALEKYQSKGVATAADLMESFRPIASKILDIDATPENASTVDKLLTGAKSIVRVRRTSPSDDDNSAEAIVARIEKGLKEARLGDVLAEAEKLPKRGQVPAADWLQKVAARQAVDKALANVDAALKTSLGAAPKAAAKGATQ